MEGIYGVDVSWLHHSHKDHHVQNSPPLLVTQNRAEGEEVAPVSKLQHDNAPAPVPPEPNGTPPAQVQHHIHRPHILSRASSEKVSQSPQASPRSPRDHGRRNSWMSSLSSKFLTSPNAAPNGPLPAAVPVPKNTTSPAVEQPNPFGAAFTPSMKDLKKQESISAQNSPVQKSGHQSFLQSALRRLSSSSPGNLGKVLGSSGVCERRTMNVDPYRPRCGIPDLEPVKLRRVAFCVDVEIAGPAKYIEEEEEELSPPASVKPSHVQQENPADAKKKKDQNYKKGEGEALKTPVIAVEEKDKDCTMKAVEEKVQLEKGLSIGSPVENETKDPTKKREKKKRSEEERKERKERKRNEALANGTVPAEVRRDSSIGSIESPEGVETSKKSQDRPTTDPLRIYRRCCQLRETPILKRITEQIASPSACPVETPGVLSVLDLSNYWMQLPDLVTLSDYLAVVPVKRLILENCGLGDEAVRVILAGLLAAKTPEQAKHNKKLSRNTGGSAEEKAEQLGVIEKLSLKNNPKIGREGWRYIALFINMSKSLKAIDLSMIPCPQQSSPASSTSSLPKVPKEPKFSTDIPTLLHKAISERLGGSGLEELVMAECELSTGSIEKIVDGVMQCGTTRLGLANNNMTPEGLEHVLRFLRTGKCQGLDLGGNNLRDSAQMLADSLSEKNALYALSLADCKLSPSSLETLLPALVRLPNFRFIDFSHNHALFATKPSALGLLRKYVPLFPILKRIHLMDVAMSSEQAIALAEVLPESRNLAHLNILENKPLSELASAKDEASQEEACALYASLMAAVRVSSTIICIDIDVPGQDSSEVVKALAKQVIAYSLRNLERIPLAESTEAGAAVDSQAGEKEVDVPDILMHLVGREDGVAENHDNDEPAPDDDYIVGGTGVVKALGVCLNRAADHCRKPRSAGDSGTATPIQTPQGNDETKGKAMEMSKNLLGSARKIRARLLPALMKEAKSGDAMSYKRLQFLDSTLERMIQRFENEYPETRLPDNPISQACHTALLANPSFSMPPLHPSPESNISNPETVDPEPESESDEAIRIPAQRYGSDVSLASRQAQEEGRMHRFGQRMRRDILLPETLDYAHGTTGQEIEASHIHDLRVRLEDFKGEEIRDKFHTLGPEGMYKAIGATVEELRALEKDDPDAFREARLAASRNLEKNFP